MTKRQREAARFWAWPLATLALLFGGMAFSQQNNDPRGSPYSSIANQALEQCFDSTGTFLCAPTGGGTPVGGSGTFRFIPKWTASNTLGDSNIREYGASEVALGYNNTNVFLTMQDRTVAASNSALTFSYDIPVADGSDQMMGALFSIDSGAKAHTGVTNSISIVVASGHDGVNPNIDEYAFHAQGGTSGYSADYRAGQSAADTGIMSAPAGFSFAVDTGPPPGFSDSVFSFTSTDGLNVMNGGDTVEFVDIDITNANHTGSTNFLYGVNLDLDVADAETVESALHMTSTWDNAMSWDTGSFSTSIAFATPTANRTATFPDATGTVALVTSTADFLTKHGTTEGVLVDSDLENAGVPAAGASGNILTFAPTLNAMDGGNDIVQGIVIDITNADHTGSNNFLYGMVIGNSATDTEAVEIGLVFDAGWDEAMRIGGGLPIVYGDNSFLIIRDVGAAGDVGTSAVIFADAPTPNVGGDFITFDLTTSPMSSGDTQRLVVLDLENADHVTGPNTLVGFDFVIDTQDPDATELAARFAGGWDFDLDFAANADLRVPDSASFLFHGATLEGLQMNINATVTENYNFGGTLNGPGGDVFVNVLPDTVEAMDGSDTQYLLQISVANADHTGSGNIMYGANVVLDTADADATEVGMRLSGWDYDFQSAGTLFANLGTPVDGTFAYCSDCAVANPCAGSGSGAFAMRLNSVWVCRETAPAYGELYVSSAAATNTTSGTPVKAAGTTTLGHAAQFDMPANNRLRYTGSSTEIFACQANTSFTSSGTPVASIFLADNGSVDATSEIMRKISTGIDEGAAATGFIVELAQNEHVELWIDTGSGDPTVTINHMTLRCAKVS